VGKEHNLFLNILTRLNKEDILRDIILIGGWCPLVYKEYFGNPVEISMQRTADLDFLIPNPPRIHKDVDISLILEELGFDRKVSLLGGYEKYVHPDLEVEFLTPEKGKGREKPYAIDKLHINAQGLRYLDLIQSHTMKTYCNGISINVPEPTAYVLHKFIISNKRKKSFKKEKDIETARQLGEYLLEKMNQRKKMREVYLGMPDKWKRDLIRIVKGTSDKLYSFLNSVDN
jgi:hypothetical protein